MVNITSLLNFHLKHLHDKIKLNLVCVPLSTVFAAILAALAFLAVGSPTTFRTGDVFANLCLAEDAPLFTGDIFRLADGVVTAFDDEPKSSFMSCRKKDFEARLF